MFLGADLRAQEQPELSPNRLDEPAIDKFAFDKALAFADSSQAAWRTRYDCVTCHTNGLHLVSRAWVGSDSAALEQNRDFAADYLRRYVEDDEKPSGGKGAVEGIVATTALLAISEARSTGKLAPFTERALVDVLERQSEHGHWPDWIKCDWPPYEVDDHFGVTLVAVAIGMAPPALRRQRAVKQGLARLQRYLKRNPPTNPHHKGMLLWASRHVAAIARAPQRKAWARQIQKLQRDDGGWSLRALGDGAWRRGDGSELADASDAYATAFCVFVLRQADIPPDAPVIRDGIAWLKANQRASGRWVVRSPKRDGKHFISHAATHFAVMALVECGIEPR